MTPSAISYVLFDLDGLLIDSESVYTTVTNRVLAPYGVEMTWQIKAGLMGKTERESAVILLSNFPQIKDKLSVDEFITQSRSLKDELFKAVQPLPGASALLKHFHAHQIPMALATSSSRRNYLIKTNHLVPSITSYFKGNIVCSDDPGVLQEGRGKPCPDIFLAAARMLGMDVGTSEEGCTEEQKEVRSKGLVFEDAVPGVMAGKRAGMKVIWVPDAQLLAVAGDTSTSPMPVVDETLSSLEEFVPERWGFPPFSRNSIRPTEE